MSRTNTFNFFGGQDPLLDPAYMDKEIEKMIELRDQMRKRQPQVAPEQQPTETSVWDDISNELNEMSDTQKALLFADEEYQHKDQQIAAIAARYQMAVLMPYVMQDEEGRKVLEEQLRLIQSKKEFIRERERHEYAEFQRWKREQASLQQQ